MTRRPLLLLLVPVLALGGGTLASAASVGFASGGIGAGTAPVARCDASVTASVALSGQAVSSVTIADIDAACAGGQLSATLTQDGTALATLPTTVVPAGGGSLLLLVPAPQPAAGSITDVRVVVVGP